MQDIGDIASFDVCHRNNWTDTDCHHGDKIYCKCDREIGMFTEVMFTYHNIYFIMWRARKCIEFTVYDENTRINERYAYVSKKNANNLNIKSTHVKYTAWVASDTDTEDVIEVHHKVGWEYTIDREFAKYLPIYIREELRKLYICVKLRKKKIDKIRDIFTNMDVDTTGYIWEKV